MPQTPDLVQDSRGGKQTDCICDTLYQYKRVWVLIDKMRYHIMNMLLVKFIIIVRRERILVKF
jgi:hypothetical protein